MNEIEKLIQELCPDGVEYRRLGEVAYYIRGVTYNKSQEVIDVNVETWKVLRANNITLSSNTLNFDDVKLISKDVKVKDSLFLQKDDILICAGSGSKNHVGKVAYIFNDINYTFGGFMATIRCFYEGINQRYLFHLLTSSLWSKYLEKALNTTTINNLNSSIVNDFEIPLPPITIQEKIVEILDMFTSLEVELEKQLEAELDARRKQYEYYREKLLTFSPDDENVRWATLKDVGSLVRGKRFVRTDILESGVPCIHYGDIYTYYGLSAVKTKTYLSSEKAKTMRFAKKNDVIIVGAGENKMDIGVGVAWLGDEKVAVHDACYIFTSEMNPRYVSHYLRSLNYHQQIFRFVSEGKICSISADNIGKAIIPIPPKEQQSSIADILDRFEALTNDLQAGLPAEIAARRQQYEYYREKLLTFKRKTVEI